MDLWKWKESMRVKLPAKRWGLAALAGARQVFHGSIAENIHLGRPT